MNAYRRNICELFQTCRRLFKLETLFIWTTALPVSQSVSGGVILNPIRFLSEVLRYDVLLANDISSRAASDSGFNVVDLHFEMRRHIDMRLRDGIHWNSKAHRRITAILLHHICFSWEVILPDRLTNAFRQLFPGLRCKDAVPETSAGDDHKVPTRSYISI